MDKMRELYEIEEAIEKGSLRCMLPAHEEARNSFLKVRNSLRKLAKDSADKTINIKSGGREDMRKMFEAGFALGATYKVVKYFYPHIRPEIYSENDSPNLSLFWSEESMVKVTKYLPRIKDLLQTAENLISVSEIQNS